MRLNRRALLKLGSLSFLRAFLPPLLPPDRYSDGLPVAPEPKRKLIGFARAINYGVAVRSEPWLRPFVVDLDSGRRVFVSAAHVAREGDPKRTPLGPALHDD